MSRHGNTTVATDPESGRAYTGQEIQQQQVNQDTVLPTYRNNGGKGSPAGSSNGEDNDRKDNKEIVDLATVEPRHEEEYSEKSAFTKKLDQYAHMGKPIIHAALVLFGLGGLRNLMCFCDELTSFALPLAQPSSSALLS